LLEKGEAAMRRDGNVVISLRFNRQERSGQEPELRKDGIGAMILTLQMLNVVFDEMVVTEIGCVHMFGVVLIDLGNERALTLHVIAFQKTQTRNLACDDCIGEEKRPLYIFIYAS
jgi:hypothetical protein